MFKHTNPLMRKNRPTYNYFQNILRLFDVLSNFPFTASETMRDYYLYPLGGGPLCPHMEKKKKKTWNVRELGIMKVSKLHRMIA